jgi:hypothetical protein
MHSAGGTPTASPVTGVTDTARSRRPEPTSDHGPVDWPTVAGRATYAGTGVVAVVAVVPRHQVDERQVREGQAQVLGQGRVLVAANGSHAGVVAQPAEGPRAVARRPSLDTLGFRIA